MGMTTTYRMRARMVRALIITTTALTTAGLAGCGSHSVGTDHDQAHAVTHVSTQVRPHYEEDSPQWNCQLDGDRQCGHVPACWTEHKLNPWVDEYPDERLCGMADTAALNSDGFVFGDYMRDADVR